MTGPAAPRDPLELDPVRVADDLAQGLLDLYAGAEQRTTAAIARALEAGMDPDGVILEKQAALVELHDTMRQVVAELEQATPEYVAVMLQRAQDAGAQAVLDELGALVGADPARLAALRRAMPGADAVSALVGRLTGALAETHVQILRHADDAYRQVVAAMAPRALMGTDTLRAVQRSTWDELVSRGITGFVDKSGRPWNLATYVEMACRATTAQAMTQASLDGYGAAGLDLIIVSDAPEECERCRPWEGQVLERNGPDGRHQVQREHGIEDGHMVTVDVAGSFPEARAAGLLHPNCRHRVKAFIPGVTKRYRNTEDPEGDANRQELRKLERNVRKAKAKEAGALGPEEKRAAAAKVRDAQEAIREHTGRTGQLRQRYREQPNLGHGSMAGARRSTGDKTQRRGVDRQLTDGQLTAPAVRAGDRPADYETHVPVEVPKPPPAPPRSLDDVDVRALTDEELDAHMADVIEAERFDLMDDHVVPEMDRRDAERQDAEARAAMTPAERKAHDRAAAKAEREQAQMEHFERLLDEGVDEAQAVAEAFGISAERQAADNAIQMLRAQGYSGKGFEDLARKSYRDHIYKQWQDAEDECNGYMLNAEGKRAGIDGLSLFSGPQSRARKYASEELRGFFERHGRLTFDEYSAQLLGDSQADRDARLRGGNGGFWL